MKSLMRICVALLLAVTITFGSFHTNANALPGADFVIDQLSNMATSTTALQKACRKGDIPGATFSLRSFEGQLCNASSFVSATAVALCKPANIEGFNGSKCDIAALRNIRADESNYRQKAADVIKTVARTGGYKEARIAGLIQ